MLYPKIYNIDKFINEHPNHHPDSKKYIDYWREEKRRCIEGYWYEEEEGVWRFVIPQLYFYANMGTIIMTDHKTKTRKRTRPKIRDVEWIIYSAYLVCRGFSGFSDDKEYSGHAAILDKDTDTLTKECYYNNKLKKYKAPLEILKQTYDKPVGIPLYQNEAQNLMLLGSRGLGKSYCVAHMILHEILFDGAKYYTKESIQNPSKIEVFVGAFKADKSSELLSKVQLALKELPGEYGSGETYRPSPLYKEMSGTLKNGNTKSPFEHLYKKKENGNWRLVGSGSKILHEIFTVENPQAAAGSRPSLLVIEEVGLLPNLKDVHGANVATQITEGKKFGTSVYIGTGGNMDKIIESEYIFRRPEEYAMLSFNDEWENTGNIGLFIPVQYTYNDLKDKDGNTNFEKANKRVEAERKGKKWDALQHQKMNYPILPSEMFLSERGSIFPQEELQQQLKYITANKHSIDRFTNYGSLYYDSDASNGVSFKQDTSGEHTPIIDYPTKRNLSLKGAVVIYEHPPEYIPENLYKITYDPVRDDNITQMSKGVSLAAIYVYKAVQKFDGTYDQLVAHYVGRYPNTDDVHEIAVKLALYYNAKIMVEMNLPGFYKYCISNKTLNLLAPTPFITLGKISPNSRNKYSFGVYMSEALIIQAEQYLIRWLLSEREVIYDEYGNPKKIRRNIDFIYDKALLEELLHYNRYLNTDRVSALLLLMLWIEETAEQTKQQFTNNTTNTSHPMVDFIRSGDMFGRKPKTRQTNNIQVYYPTLDRTYG